MSEAKPAVIYVGVRSIKLATVNNYLEQVKTILASQAVVTGLVDTTAFNGLVSDLQSAMVAKKRFTQTERLEQADRLRDTMLSAIGYYLRGQATMPTDKQQDAKDLYGVLKDFGITAMRTASYGDETALIKSYIERLNSGDNVAKLAKFPELEDWTTALEEANTAFTAIMNEKADEVQLDFTNASQIREKIAPVYEAMINEINAHTLIGTAPEFATTVEAINGQIVAYHLD